MPCSNELAVMVPRRQLAPLRRRLLGWYRANRRDLPWRRGRDPYRIWVAEIMLQQTRISAVLPYYERFLARFPNIRELARARESEILKYWAGLGYYSRARNLHRAAREIVRSHDAQFPREPQQALALAGIGRYTAAAILSIAFDVPLAALDGNVARVLARLFAVRGELRAPKTWQRLAGMAQTLLPPRAPGEWNQAMMELGETICTPRSPNCAACPIARHCKARALGIAKSLPAARQKRAPANVHIAAAVLVDSRGRTLLTKIPGAHDSALFSRLWQFPAVAIAANGNSAHHPARGSSDAPANGATNELAEHLGASLGISSQPLTPLPVASHTVTFRRITLAPFLVRVARLPKRAGCRTLPLANLARLPVSSATQKIARAALNVLAQ
ncbi:MAG TPA: A/G-specific adenine glycosylase [Candidatus Acidoferrales bacterium]|nr:A/G-specific adenine glycosylase [Candidatus Acidoferrales bacterium]